ncbi:MAG: hypothetical protein KAS71_15140 [Bacteroidales bacterium]|nr:hypothetical protein [Bacteroidales bacterium]
MNTFNIIIKKEQKHYLISTIRTIPEKCELFYHFPWGSRTKGKYIPIDLTDENNGYLYDHISFHSDGKVHSKAKNDKKKKIYLNNLDIEKNIFNLERSHFLPFLVDSFFIDNINNHSRFKEIDINQLRSFKIWEIPKNKSFSIILISKCGLINPGKMIKDHGFERLTLIKKQIVLKDAFNKEISNGTDIVILLVEETWSERDQKEHNHSDLQNTTITMPPMKMIAEMKNNNRQ